MILYTKEKKIKFQAIASSSANYTHSLSGTTLLVVLKDRLIFFDDFCVLLSLPPRPISQQILAMHVLPNHFQN